MRYLIWSFEHGAWWKAHRAGYTSDINHAGLYSAEAAIEILCSCEVSHEHPVREEQARSDMWPATTVRSLRYPSDEQWDAIEAKRIKERERTE